LLWRESNAGAAVERGLSAALDRQMPRPLGVCTRCNACGRGLGLAAAIRCHNGARRRSCCEPPQFGCRAGP